jgi:ferritin
MLTEKMQDGLNGQFNAELYSAYLYLSMAAYYESIGMPGFASWMRVQRLEELVHAMKFFDYIVEGGGRVLLRPVDGPPTEWEGGALGPFEAAYAHEQKVTGLINALVEIAREENDAPTEEFLQWYVEEQVEEEESTSAVVESIKAAGGSVEEFEKLDGELAMRT